jgi:AcrR family transcriptional regulator
VRIAEAARALWLAQRYRGVSMTDVTERAEVAVQTLYNVCPGGKPALAKLVWEITLAGDAEDIPQHARPAVQAIIAQPDPVQKMNLYAAVAATPRPHRRAQSGVARRLSSRTSHPTNRTCTRRPNASGSSGASRPRSIWRRFTRCALA